MARAQPKRRKAVTALFLLLLLILAGDAAFYYFVSRESARAAAFRDQVVKRRDDETAAISLKNLLSVTEGERTELESYFVSQATIVTYIEELESLGTAAGAKVILTSVENDKSNKNVLRATLSMSGSFEGLYHFLSLLESLPYELTVTRFSVSQSSDGDKGAPVWQGDAAVELSNFISS